MIANVNIEEVKKFNGALKQYKDRAVQINTEIEFLNKEVQTLCAELSAELGIEVNMGNIEQICEEQAAKINAALESGSVVLSKIASEEANASAQAAAIGAREVVQTAPVAPAAPVAPVAPAVPVAPVAPAAPVAPVTSGAIFNNNAGAGMVSNVSIAPDSAGTVDPSTLPSLFGNRH